MNITQTTQTEVRYESSEERLTVADLSDIVKDLRERKAPKGARVFQGGVRSVTVQF